VPILGFISVTVVFFMALAPGRVLGAEYAAIFAIFTSQAWNMAFSFYSSLKSIPRELQEACTINRFSRWQRLWQLELPYAAIGLVWNSMVSVAGGWFFLMVCEMFPVGNRQFRLPGLGSYLQTAAATGNSLAMTYGLLTMVAIIVLTDQLAWRPVIDWSDKFKFENIEAAERVKSPVLASLRQSNMLAVIQRHTIVPLTESIYRSLARTRARRRTTMEPEQHGKRASALTWILLIVILGLVCFAAFKAILLLKHVPRSDVGTILLGAIATFFRVNISLLLAAAWTIPVGVAIGFNPKLARIAQPLAQIAASFPATALFPVILIGLMKLGAGLGIGSIALMMLGTQWYILFNVIAGAMAIPSEMREVATLFRFTDWQRWTTVILPGIFPFLITGLVTASGGAWNASIIAEYFHLKDQTLRTLGLGAQISAASDAGDFPVLLLATIIMALMVVTINRLVWRPLYHLAETKYRLD
jgi:NitT/TauT family transport system permease protein